MTSPATDPGLPYRPCVGIALFNPAGLVFVGRRVTSGTGRADASDWQMPQGGIDAGEAPVDAALRELYEETNVSPGSVTLLAEHDEWLSYDLPPALIGRALRGRYRGQTQRWVAFGFTGNEDEIDVARPGGGAHSAEFDAWRWERLEATPNLIVPFKRPVYEAVAAAFSGLAAWRASR